MPRDLLSLTALLFVLTSCSTTKSPVGEGLLTDITGQTSRRDTVEYPLEGSAAITHASIPMRLSHSSSQRILVGEANGLRGTMLLKFAPLTAWSEQWVYQLEGKTLFDTVTITPVAIEADSVSTTEIRLTFGGFVTDSSRITLAGWTTDGSWSPDDSVTASLPAFHINLVSGLSPDSILPYDVVRVPIPPTALSRLINDTLSLAVQGEGGTPMHQYTSREDVSSYGPQIILWVKATVESKRRDIPPPPDSVIGLSLLPAYDTYRLERLGAAPSPRPDEILLASGAPWRGFIRLNRFDVPGLSVDGVVPKETTVNSAILELRLDSLEYTFQRDAAHIEIYPLAEPFNFEKMQQGEITISARVTSGAGFTPDEVRGDSANVRRFQIADLLNTWWHDSTTNEGLLLNLDMGLEEARRVDAVEIVGTRLVLITTLPPVFVQKPAHADSPEPTTRPEPAR